MPPLIEAADPSASGATLLVQQGYAQVLQGCLGRASQTPFDLAGLQLYTDVQAIAASLQRCVAQHDDSILRHWCQIVAGIVTCYDAAFAEVAEAQTWVTAIRQVLDAAPVPTAHAPAPGGDAVARQLAHVLGGLADRTDLSPWLQTVRGQVCGVSERYWRGLFVCYDVVGVPRTNNDLESLFGATRRRVRQQTGAKQVRRSIGRQGAWLLYPPDTEMRDVQQRLEGVPYAVYQHERAHFEQRQARFRQRFRWRRNRAGVLDQLESQWTSECANSTV